jgi:fatty acid synthase subunit alpha
VVSQELKSYGVSTFSAKGIAFNILGLTDPLLFGITQADLNGGMDRLPELTDITSRTLSDIMRKSDSHRTTAKDNAADFKTVNGVEAERVLQTVYVTPKVRFPHPPLGRIIWRPLQTP